MLKICLQNIDYVLQGSVFEGLHLFKIGHCEGMPIETKVYL